LLTVSAGLSCAPLVRAQAYDPLLLSNDGVVPIEDRTIQGSERQRSIPVRIYLPPSNDQAHSTFGMSYLKRDAAAAKWLDGPGRRSVMQTEDRWLRK
jgi:hypothetical protein